MPLIGALASCAGIFQRSIPDRVDQFERHATGELRVGVATADITPTGAPYLGGFDLNRRATGVASRLEVRAMVFLMGGARVAVVGIDNLGLHLQDVDWIKSGIDGFANGSVFLCASHTHAAPDLIGMWGWYFVTSGRDREYLAQVGRATRRAVAEALASARPAKLSRGEARVAPHGMFGNTNRAGVFDRRLTVVHAVDRATGDAIGSLLHTACHPEVLRRADSVVSADFVGSLCDEWRAAGHGTPVFVNGALGAMITPRRHGVHELEPTGERLFAVASRALATAQPMRADELVVRRREVFLPMDSWALRLGRVSLVIPRELYSNSLRSTVGYLRIGEFEAVCLPGEAEPGYAQRIRSASGRPSLVVFGLVDDEVGYLMTERDARDELFAYERTMSPGPMAGEIVLDALVR